MTDLTKFSAADLIHRINERNELLDLPTRKYAGTSKQTLIAILNKLQHQLNDTPTPTPTPTPDVPDVVSIVASPTTDVVETTTIEQAKIYNVDAKVARAKVRSRLADMPPECLTGKKHVFLNIDATREFFRQLFNKK